MAAKAALLDTTSGERFIRIRTKSNNPTPLDTNVNDDRSATADGSLGLTWNSQILSRDCYLETRDNRMLRVGGAVFKYLTTLRLC